MKIVQIETLLSKGTFANSIEWENIRKDVFHKIKEIDWPLGSGSFTIYPQSGKKRKEGNGVTPIKNCFIEKLKTIGWKEEQPLNIAARKRPGNMDAALYTKYGVIALEWETGNISSSHRSLNKMCLGLIKGILIAGILIVPSRALYKYLTDRVGNWDELEPYTDLWKNLNITHGILEIIVIEHDDVSKKSPRIPKGTDGRALV